MPWAFLTSQGLRRRCRLPPQPECISVTSVSQQWGLVSAENRASFVGRTMMTSISCQASTPIWEPKPPDQQNQVHQPASQPARAWPGETCHHYHRGLYSFPQRQSQKCTEAIQSIPSIQIFSCDIILGFCEAALLSAPFILALLSFLWRVCWLFDWKTSHQQTSVQLE